MGKAEKLRIALLQIAPAESLEGNLEKGIRACEEARDKGADIALFPEMWSCGYSICGDPEVWKGDAIGKDSAFTAAFASIASRLDMAVGLTILEEHEPSPRNTFLLFDRHGECVLAYAKVHTCDFSCERALSPGDSFPVCTLDTRLGPVKAGAMICYDREFPESARLLMLSGAELVLVPNACPMEINRLSQLRARAFENMMAIATCNYPEGVPDCNGRSSIFDGIAWLPDSEGSRDCLLLLADGNEGIYTADLDIAALRKYRETEVFGDAYRRPRLYGMLAENSPCHPFIRPDSRR